MLWEESTSKLCQVVGIFEVVGPKFLFPCRSLATGGPRFLEAVHTTHGAPYVFETVMLHQVFFFTFRVLIFLLPSFSLAAGVSVTSNQVSISCENLGPVFESQMKDLHGGPILGEENR